MLVAATARGVRPSGYHGYDMPFKTRGAFQ